MHSEYTNISSEGISRRNRLLLDLLNREAKGPFTILEASRILKIDIAKSRRIVSYWASRGWLVRVRRGLYATVPLGAISPAERREDPWVIANMVFEPCYIGGWSACEHWGLADQIFRDIVVFTSSKIRRRKNEIQGTVYIVRHIEKDKIFGIKPVWRGQHKILVSDPSRTLVDILNEPYLGGGIRNVADILIEYYDREDKDENKLLDYAIKMKNGAIFKRLGYLIESLGINSPRVIEVCKNNITSGYSLLDPSLPPKSKIVRRWNLRINASIGRRVE